MSYSDEYDEFSELPIDHQGLAAFDVRERTVRRRSSKACDQCRKSKCKCERSAPDEPCKSCVMLGTPCTFLGPSRKRGPPKGYIDAIEARLHQTEALLGIMLATSDPRAQSLLRDMEKDPLAKEIIARVNNSPYGVKGRKGEDIALTLGAKVYSGQLSEGSPPGQLKSEPLPMDLTSTHPSNQWQDHVSSMLNKLLVSQNEISTTSSRRSDLRSDLYTPKPAVGHSNDDNKRRRVGDDDYSFQQPTTSSSSTPPVHHEDSTRIFTNPGSYLSLTDVAGSPLRSSNWRSSVDDSLTSDSEDDELMGAVGQLSLNEDEQVRYHGKASGLHLLGNKERLDRRNEGGIWRFPKARVWPPLPSGSTTLSDECEFVSQLPSADVQEHLLDLYFTYVHPSFPIIHKQAFFDSYKAGTCADSPDPDTPNNASPFNHRRGRVPTLLLLSIFAIASRYDDTEAPVHLDPSMMWEAGDEYLNSAKVILDRSYASSRFSTCQSLLLMGYREVGIGAMAQAWTYIGMAIRMAQDLGMHRSADGWERVRLGGRLFNESELNERKRIWFGCVILDKYVSTYIGRPLMIFERDYDTTLPNDNDIEEHEELVVCNSHGELLPGVPGRVMSCFNASANLSNILSMIVQTIYAVRPIPHRHAESTVLEGLLDKWYIDLPDHLRYEPGISKQPVPLPNVLTLHMQYWCAVLLLHRPFIRSIVHAKHRQPEVLDDGESSAIAAKSYELCNAAANHITSIVSVYQEHYMLTRCSAFLCYYVFTASIMHVTNLTVHPTDPQSRLGITKCMQTLCAMQIVWPSAGRALELCRGAKVDSSGDAVPLVNPPPSVVRHKRSAEQLLDDSFSTSHHHFTNNNNRFDDDMHTVCRTNTQQQQQQQQQQSNYIEGFGSGDGAGNYLASISTSPASSQSQTNSNMAVPPCYTWQGGGMNTNGINTHLSTAVLPQIYSTGLVDDVNVHGSSRTHHHSIFTNNQHTTNPSSSSSRRYAPPYYDYSNFVGPAIGPMYDIRSEPIQVSSQQLAQSQVSHQMYIPEHYGIYDGQFTAR